MANLRVFPVIAAGAALATCAIILLAKGAEANSNADAVVAPAATQEQQQRRPNQCEIAAQRASQLINANLPLPPQVRRQVAPVAYAVCQQARQRLG